MTGALRALVFGLLTVAGLAGCGDELTPIRGTTMRVGKPQPEDGTELELRIFTTEADCLAAVGKEDAGLCLPHVDRASGEVRLGFQFRLDSEEFYLPVSTEHLRVVHQGTEVGEQNAGQSYTVIPHDPIRAPQLFILVIDGSSSMLDNNRMEKVREALLLDEVRDAFFPPGITTGVVILSFTNGKPQPLGGVLRVITDKADYTKTVKSELRVLNGYTHLFSAITYASGELLADKEINNYIDLNQAEPTIIALTDGFNNLTASDTCKDNAERLSILLNHIKQARYGDDVDIRKRPAIYTVGLGKPLRPAFKLPEDAGADVSGLDLCSKRYLKRRIDGDLERLGIDNASLDWIARLGGGFSYVRLNKKGLGEAFRAAAAERYRWFEVRYRMDPFYLRRQFRSRLRLLNLAAAESSVVIHPSAWLDAPTGVRGPDGWTLPRPYLHTSTVVLPGLGVIVSLTFLGAAFFNTRRALLRRARQSVRRAPEPPAGGGAPPNGAG